MENGSEREIDSNPGSFPMISFISHFDTLLGIDFINRVLEEVSYPKYELFAISKFSFIWYS